ncbi:hypothetical protein NX059_003746 [Plenodomus lindquistii]|nr:hypothetical protein NX059_003746 [Plenodomus lindquistii]
MDSGASVTSNSKYRHANANFEERNGPDRSEVGTMVEAEECRRTLWLLFIMDRTQAWPTGWPHAIPESQFKVDLPIADTRFQALDPEIVAIPQHAVPFARQLDLLICTLNSAKQPWNLLHYIAVANVLLGKVADLTHSLHDDCSTVEYAENCAELDAMVIQFRLNIPREASTIMEAPFHDRSHVLWLQVTLSTVEMLLHYRNYGSIPPEKSSKFRIAVNAARNIARMVRDALQSSFNLLVSSHFASSLYVAACILVIQWRTTGQGDLEEEINLFKLVFERMNEVFTFQGVKFGTALELEMEKRVDEIKQLRERGYKGLMADCSTWKVPFEAALSRKGIVVDIT